MNAEEQAAVTVIRSQDAKLRKSAIDMQTAKPTDNSPTETPRYIQSQNS